MVSLRQIGACALLIGLILGGSSWSRGLAQATPTAQLASPASGAPAIDPRSDALVKRMATYLTALPSFTVRATNTMQVMLMTGEKLDFEAVSDVSVRRPDGVRTRRSGTAVNADFFYDGKTVTVFDRTTKFFTVNAAPASIDRMLVVLQEMLGVEVPGADLLFTDAYEGLMSDVIGAHHVAIEEVGGVAAHHLAFRGREVDWQIWIEDGDRPLPLRYVITTKWMTGAPQFGVTLSNWNLSPQFDAKTFVFEAPAGAMKVDVLKPSVSPGKG